MVRLMMRRVLANEVKKGEGRLTRVLQNDRIERNLENKNAHGAEMAVAAVRRHTAAFPALEGAAPEEWARTARLLAEAPARVAAARKEKAAVREQHVQVIKRELERVNSLHDAVRAAASDAERQVEETTREAQEVLVDAGYPVKGALYPATASGRATGLNLPPPAQGSSLYPQP